MDVRPVGIIVVLAALFLNAAPTLSRRLALVDHSLLTDVLKDVVYNGRVDYSQLKGDTRLTAYLTTMSKISTSGMTREDLLAYWINVYNAATLLVVTKHYPVQSIRDISINGFASVWKAPIVSTRQGKISLDKIEHEILRPLGDARIHAALVCAAMSCPPLRSEAFTAARLNDQLDDQCRRFVRDRRHVIIDTQKRTAHVSKIFEWFMVDFGGNEIGIVDFLYRYTDVERPIRPLTVTFMDYDWSLNAQ